MRWPAAINILRPRQNGRHFADDIFKCIFLYENVLNPINISLKFVPKGPINNIPALVQIMAWRRPGDKPLSEPMMVSLTTHICVTRPQWVKLEMTKVCIPHVSLKIINLELLPKIIRAMSSLMSLPHGLHCFTATIQLPIKLRPFGIQWRHDKRIGVSNHRHLDCLLERLFRRRSTKTSKLLVTGLCEGNPLLTDWFSSHRACKAENNHVKV